MANNVPFPEVFFIADYDMWGNMIESRSASLDGSRSNCSFRPCQASTTVTAEAPSSPLSPAPLPIVQITITNFDLSPDDALYHVELPLEKIHIASSYPTSKRFAHIFDPIAAANRAPRPPHRALRAPATLPVPPLNHRCRLDMKVRSPWDGRHLVTARTPAVQVPAIFVTLVPTLPNPIQAVETVDVDRLSVADIYSKPCYMQDDLDDEEEDEEEEQNMGLEPIEEEDAQSDDNESAEPEPEQQTAEEVANVEEEDQPTIKKAAPLKAGDIDPSTGLPIQPTDHRGDNPSKDILWENETHTFHMCWIMGAQHVMAKRKPRKQVEQEPKPAVNPFSLRDELDEKEPEEVQDWDSESIEDDDSQSSDGDEEYLETQSFEEEEEAADWPEPWTFGDAALSQQPSEEAEQVQKPVELAEEHVRHPVIEKIKTEQDALKLISSPVVLAQPASIALPGFPFVKIWCL